MRLPIKPTICWLFVTLMLAGCNLAGDVTPPPGAVLTAPAPAQSTPDQIDVSAPAAAPEASAGAAIYADRCAPCHGEQGLGDGPQAQDLPVQPAALADPDLARTAVPEEWYAVVTNGRMDRLMPPFGSLTDQERWNVVAYALSLSIEEQQIERGQVLFEQHCAQCHVSDGDEVGEVGDLTDPSRFAQVSRARTARVVQDGLGQDMPGFEAELNEDDINAVAAYTQALAWRPRAENRTESQTREGLQESEPSEAENSLQVSGLVRNGTREQPIAEQLEVTLHGFEGQQEAQTATTMVAANGTYSFADLERIPGRVYVASVDYEGVRYVSPVVELDADSGALELPITVYEVTSDSSNVHARQLHVLIDRPGDDRLQVVELWLLVNRGDRTVRPDQAGGGVEIHIPDEALNIRFEDQQQRDQVVPTEAGFVLATPLRPEGQGFQLGFSFEIPFQGSGDLQQRITVPVDTLSVLAVEGAPEISGPGLTEMGRRQAGGQALDLYQREDLATGETLSLEFSAGPLWTRVLSDARLPGWWIGLIVLALTVAGVLWWYRPFEPDHEADSGVSMEGGEGATREDLLQAVADLDDTFDAGDLEPEAYERRRRALMRRLLMMEPQDD